MDYIETFKNASEQTQYIIVGINTSFTVLYLIASGSNRNRVPLFGIAIIAIAALYFVVNFLSGITVTTYLMFYHAPSIMASFILWGLWQLLKGLLSKKKPGEFDIEIATKAGKKIRFNIVRGVSVSGAAGSGKTASVAAWILHYMGLRSMPGLVYDFKDFELTEQVLGFYRESSIPINIFSPAEPNKTQRLNCLDPKILKRPEDVILMGKTIVSNVLKTEKGGDNFFTQAAEGAIVGAIIRLKEDFPHFCTFAHLSAIFLSYDTDNLVSFIESNANASRQARAFLDSADSEKQMAAVKASLSNAFRVFDMPTLFYALSENEVPLALNDEKPSVLCLVNKPKYVDIYAPIFSIVTQACLLEMSQRDRKGSYLLLDEAPTLRIPKIERVPATMRSFKIATIYMLQDKIQAANQVGADVMKEILSNLSTIFFGKTNDPDTAKFFESYFPDIKVKQKSISKKSGAFGGGGDARISESEKDEKQHKSQEMFKRKAGEFFVFDQDGNSYDAKIKLPLMRPEKPKNVNTVTEWELNNNYKSIFLNINSLK